MDSKFLYDQKTKDFLLNRKKLMVVGYVIFTIFLITDIILELINLNNICENINDKSTIYIKLYTALIIGLKITHNICLLHAIIYYDNYNLSNYYVCLSFILDIYVKPLLLIIPIRDLIVFDENFKISVNDVNMIYIMDSIIDNINCFLLFQASIIQASLLYNEFKNNIYKFYVIIGNIVYIPMISIAIYVLFNLTKNINFIIFYISYVLFLLTLTSEMNVYFRISIRLFLLAGILGIIGKTGIFMWIITVQIILHFIYMTIFLRDVLIRISSKYDPQLEQFTEEWHKNNQII
jgi:hypothetical protein